MRVALVSVCTDKSLIYPMGLLYMLSYCQTKLPNIQFTIIEERFEDAENIVRNGEFDVVGISAMTPEYERATRFAKRILDLLIPIVLGGVHISSLPESFRSCFTYGVVGEGEQTFVELLEHIGSGGCVRSCNVPGIVRYVDGNLKRNPARPPMKLEEFPALDYSKIDQRYFKRQASAVFGEFGVSVPLMTSRGCPFKCIFCGGSHLWGSVRYFSTDWVLREISTLKRMGVTHIEVYDDLFAANKNRLRAIVDGLNECEIKFYGNAQAHILDDETCKLMVRMNMRRLFFGFESGNQRVLSMLKCGKVKVEDNKNAIVRCLKHGIKPSGNVILGSPTETLSEMQDTLEFVRWARKHGAERITMSVMKPDPGTPLWETAKKMGRVHDNMDFEELIGLADGRRLDGFVLDESINPKDFARMVKRINAALHPFKWRKLLSFLKNDPLSTIKMALSSGWPVVKRMFMPSMP